MARLVYYAATTLDGFIADPDDSLAWLLRQPQEPGGPLGYEDFIAGIGAVVMGSTTYEWLLDHPEENGGGWPYPMPAWVLTSRDLPPVEGGDVRFVRGDVRPVYDDVVAAAGDKDAWVIGGGDLAGQFADLGLLDEVIVWTAPVVLGSGRPLLPRRLDLELLESGRNGAFICARYRVAGPLAEDRDA